MQNVAPEFGYQFKILYEIAFDTILINAKMCEVKQDILASCVNTCVSSFPL